VDRLTLNFRAFLAGLVLLMLVGLFAAFRVDAQTVTTTREGEADWRCCDDTACSTSTAHQRQDKAIEACVNRTFADGKVRWIVPARYRVAVTLPAPPEPPAEPPPATTELLWTPPTRNEDGTAIRPPVSYRIEAQSGAEWTPLATVTTLAYEAPGATGCWRVVTISADGESGPTGAVCKGP